MKYNLLKRGLELGASICALCYCAIDIIIVLISLANMSRYLGELESTFIAGIVIGIVLMILEIIFASLLIKAPVLENGAYKSKTSIRVSFIVFSSIIAFFLIAGISQNSANILVFLLFVAIIVLESFAMAQKDVKHVLESSKVPLEEEQAESIASTTLQTENQDIVKAQTTEEKILELKSLLKEGVLTEEQYKEAVQKVIDKIN